MRFVTRQTWKKTTEPTSQMSFASEAIELGEMSCMALYASTISAEIEGKSSSIQFSIRL